MPVRIGRLAHTVRENDRVGDRVEPASSRRSLWSANQVGREQPWDLAGKPRPREISGRTRRIVREMEHRSSWSPERERLPHPDRHRTPEAFEHRKVPGRHPRWRGAPAREDFFHPQGIMGTRVIARHLSPSVSRPTGCMPRFVTRRTISKSLKWGARRELRPEKARFVLFLEWRRLPARSRRCP